ncbi:MAG: hypothetical protein JOY97_08860 [Hyphomicrobiales bacterium]|nr:hypothetical protein [Hyphomicrobiales bacterium]
MNTYGTNGVMPSSKARRNRPRQMVRAIYRKGLQMSMITRFRPLSPASPGRASLGFALAAGMALVAFQPNLANAQFWGGYGSWDDGGPRAWSAPPPGPRYQDEDLLRPGEISDVLRDHGWTILSPPSMSGRHYVANVRNGFGQRLFVVLDAYDGRILDARQVEERPNTNELAAIPSYSATSRPDEVIRPAAPLPAPPTPAPRSHRYPPVQAKHNFSPPSVKTTPLEPPKEKEGTIAVAKPTAAPPAVKHVIPAPSAPETSGSSAPSASPTPAPTVRQVYPAPGGTPSEPPAPAPKAAAEASPTPTPPAAQAPSKPAPAVPAKPALPADAGYE